MEESRHAGQTSSQVGRRRVFLGLGAGALVLSAGWFGSSRLRNGGSYRFAFEDIPDLPGFRRMLAGKISRSVDPFAGIDAKQVPSEAEFDGLKTDLCGALFRDSELSAAALPIASFSDYRCPYCRVLTKILADIESRSGGAVSVSWHEWPLLGDVSEVAARAALAAKRQGAYLAFHSRLMRTPFVPTPSYLEAMAKDAGIDPTRLISEMNSPAVSREIDESRALAALFRFPGTPALVVGRTAVVGGISESNLKKLIDLEFKERSWRAC